MKITSLFIDGFGKFSQWSPPDRFGDGVTAVIGPNEAGKTTMLAFIRRMLYGFPDGRKKDLNHYQPVNGGKIGGRLAFQTDAGEAYLLFRDGVRGSPTITRPDGTEVSGSLLPSLLGPADQVFYENICAISLDELQEFGTIDRKEIRDRLAAAGSGNLPVRKVADELGASADAIYAVRGKKKQINTRITDLKDLEQKIRTIKENQGEYDRINQAISEKREELARKKGEKKRFEEEIIYATALSKAWDLYLEREEAIQAREQVPETGPFPEDALLELGRLVEEVRRLEDDSRDRMQQCERIDTELEAVRAREEILNQADAIRSIERMIERYRSQKDDLTRHQLDREQKEKRSSSQLENLGGDWSRERITGFDTSIPIINEIKALHEDLERTDDACKNASINHAAAKKTYAEKREYLTQVHQRRADIGVIPDPGTAQNLLGQARDLLGVIQEIERLEDDLASIRKEEARTHEIIASLKIPPAPKPPAWPGYLVFLAAILALIGGFLAEALLPATALAAILIIAGAGILFFRGAANDTGRSVTEDGSYQEEAQTLAAERNGIERRRSDAEEKGRRIAGAFGLASIPSRRESEDLRDHHEDLVTLAGRGADLEKDISRAEALCRTASTDLKAREDALAHARSGRKDAVDAWKSWCQIRGLPDTTHPELITHLIGGIKEAKDLITAIDGDRKREKTLYEEIQSFEEDIRAVAAACGEPVAGAPDTLGERLVDLLEDAEETKRRERSLLERRRGEENAMESTRSRLNNATGMLTTLLQSRGAATPDEYRERERLSRERQELKRRIHEADGAIRRISGEERFDDVIMALGEYDPIVMTARLREMEDEQSRIHTAIEEINQEIGTLQERSSMIEGDDRLTALISDAAALREEISRISREWAVYTTASSLLAMAVETFEREKQPAILQEAQSFFSGITGGRYTRIIKPLDSAHGSDLFVEERRGGRKRVDELSRGTAEQLYLALRFGYIRDYVHTAAPVPVIFDDILVNFDPGRRKNACKAIAELAETCQVLYFTCHPETVADLTSAAPGTVVMDLSGI